MSISFKKIIHKLDRIIQPQKYYTNHVTKKIKKLNKGDKMYALHMPNIQQMSIVTSLSALDYISIQTCTVKDIHIEKIGKTPIIRLSIILSEITQQMISGLNYYKQFNSQNYIVMLTLNENEANYTIMYKKYNGYFILSTDKNIIIRHIKSLACTIKKRILERVMFNEEHNEKEYGNHHIINFKKQYAKLLQQIASL